MKRFALTAAAGLLAPLAAEAEDPDFYVEANLLGIFYHELGHALIDTMSLPIFGQEEDAADVLSIVLIDAFFEEDRAVAMAYEAAFGFQAEAEEGGDVAWWDVHGPDLQRYYNLVCLFYGANPDEREDVAVDLGLPDERQETCPEEFDLASDSWGGVLDQLADLNTGQGLELQQAAEDAPGADLLEDILRIEVEAFNAEFDMPVPVMVTIAECDEANAFYDPDLTTITMCAEFVGHLQDQTQSE